MDWNAAIDRNREALKRVLATLVGMAALAGSGATLPRHLHRFVLRLLRPAEAAARRLVIVAARGLTLPPPRQRKPAIPRKAGRGKPIRPQSPSPRAPALPLFDPLPRWNVRARPVAVGVPRISFPGFSDPFPIAIPRPDDPIDATRLTLRLQALAAALDDLPGQAKRFARWRGRRADARDEAGNTAQPAGLSHMEAPPPLIPPHKGEGDPVASRPRANHGGLFATGRQSPPPPCGEGLGVGVPRDRGWRRMSSAITLDRPRRLWPLRPGRPPGWRRKSVHEVHEVLNVVHGLAFWALETPDTS